MPSEFDDYAKDYAKLVTHPVRDWFSSDQMFYHRRKWVLLQRFLAQRGAQPGTLQWLDVGCGKGELLSLGQGFFAEAAGCDPSVEMLDQCGKLPVKLQTASDTLPFEDARFDLVSAVCVYHHMSQREQQALTAEVFRVLRPRGIFVIMEHNPWNPVTRFIVRRTPVDVNAVLLAPPLTYAVLRRAKFEKLSTQHFLYLPAQLYRMAGALENLMTHIPLGGQYAVFGEK